MLPMEELSPEEMQQVSSFILTLAGTTPANPKEPQGELFSPSAPEPTVTDSTTVIASIE